MKLHLERALFMIGRQYTGKNTQLLSLKELIAGRTTRRRRFDLGNNRWLYVRSGSPQEEGQDLDDFLLACARHMQPRSYQWNYACAMQSNPGTNIGGAVSTIKAFKNEFSPGRVCAVILCPDWRGNRFPEERKSLITRLSDIGVSEILTVDARKRHSNGPQYAGFFGI